MEYLELYRKARGYTQQQMADFLEISKETYACYELGTEEPSLETMMKIANILGVLIDQLTGMIQPDATYSGRLRSALRSDLYVVDTERFFEAIEQLEKNQENKKEA